MGHDPDRVGFSWLPPYHDMGLMGTIFVSMFQGVPLVLMSPMHFVQAPRRWLEAITDYRVTITVGPNFSLDLCSAALRDEEAEDLDLSTVQRLYCGAEPISADTLARFEADHGTVGVRPERVDSLLWDGRNDAVSSRANVAIGSTAPTAHQSRQERAALSSAAAKSTPNTRCESSTPPTSSRWTTVKSARSGCRGEVSPTAITTEHEQTREVFHARLADEEGEYLRTGDLGFVRSGELFVTGRIKDLIIVNGRNIYPQDVEAAVLHADPAFRIAAAFSIPGDSSEQLCVVAEVGHRELSTELYAEMVEAIRSSVTSEFGISTSCSPLSEAHHSDDHQRKSPPAGGQADVPGERVAFFPGRSNDDPGVHGMSHTISQRQNAPTGRAPQRPERDVLASRLAYLTVGLPTVGTIGAIVYAVYDGLWLSDVVLFAVMYLITGLGVEAGLHRYFTHRSFEASEPVKVFLAVAGSMAAQGPVVFWVANHRLHHAFADTDRDPHSPQPQGPGIWGRAKGLVARSCWLALRCEEDRLEPAYP